MEKEKKEMALKAIQELKPADKIVDFYEKLEAIGADKVLTQDEADVIFGAYKKGCNEYNTRAWTAEDKYTRLSIKLADKMINA